MNNRNNLYSKIDIYDDKDNFLFRQRISVDTMYTTLNDINSISEDKYSSESKTNSGYGTFNSNKKEKMGYSLKWNPFKLYKLFNLETKIDPIVSTEKQCTCGKSDCISCILNSTGLFDGYSM